MLLSQRFISQIKRHARTLKLAKCLSQDPIDELAGIRRITKPNQSLDTLPQPLIQIQGSSASNLNLFNELSGNGVATIEKRKNVMWLNIGPHKGILRIGIYKESNKNTITIQLEILKKVLGSDKTNEMLTKVV